MATQTKKQTRTKGKAQQTVPPATRTGLSDDESNHNREDDRLTSRMPPGIPSLPLPTPKVARDDLLATPGGSTPHGISPIPLSTPHLVTAQWTASPTGGMQGLEGEQMQQGYREEGIEHSRATGPGARPVPSNYGIYFRNVNTMALQISENVEGLAENMTRMQNELKDTRTSLKALIQNLRDNEIRYEQGLDAEEYRLPATSPSTWTQAITPMTDDLRMRSPEPVVDAAVSLLKEKQREGETPYDYGRRMAAVDRLGMNDEDNGRRRETDSISQYRSRKDTRFNDGDQRDPGKPPRNTFDEDMGWRRSENRAGGYDRRSTSRPDTPYRDRPPHQEREPPDDRRREERRSSGDQRGQGRNPPSQGGHGGGPPGQGPPGGPPDGNGGGDSPGHSENGGNSDHEEDRDNNRSSRDRRARSMTPFPEGDARGRTSNQTQNRGPTTTNNRLFAKDSKGRVVDNSFVWITETIDEMLGEELETSRSIKMKEPDRYDGRDDLDMFDEWLMSIVRWMALMQLGGPKRDRLRLITLGQCLSKNALEWYNSEVASPNRLHRKWTYKEAICELFDHFIHKVSGKKASNKFKNVKYDPRKGASHLFTEMRKYARRMIETPSEYDQSVVFVEALPEEIRKGLRIARQITEERNSLEEIYRNTMEIEEAINNDKWSREVSEKHERKKASSEKVREDQTRREEPKHVPRSSHHHHHHHRGHEKSRLTNRPEGFQKLRKPHARTHEDPKRREEKKLPSSSKATQGTAPQSKEHREKGKEKSRDSDKSHIQCYKCKSYGHFANDPECPLVVKPAIRRFKELPETAAKTDKEAEVEVVMSEVEGEEGNNSASESENQERSYGGSQYDSEASMYYGYEEYDSYTSESEEEPVSFRAMTIASLRGDEEAGEAGPSNQVTQETEGQDTVVEGLASQSDGERTEDMPELEDIPEVEEGSDISMEIARVRQGPVGEFWRTEYSRVNALLEREEEMNLRLRQQVRELEMENRGLEARISEMGNEIRTLWRTYAPDVPQDLAREVVHNSMWREIVRGSPGLQGDIQQEFEGQGEPPLTQDDEQRMVMAEAEARDRREEERRRGNEDTVLEEIMRAMGPERDREYRSSIEPKKGARPTRAFKCLTAYVKVNGLKALALFDSGSSIDAISTEFARVANVKSFELEKPVPIQLGTVGSRSVINFGTKIPVSIHGNKEEIYLDIVNVDHYDIIVGVPLMNRYGISLDFDENKIRLRGGGVMASLKAGEEVATAKPKRRVTANTKPTKAESQPQESK
ncbi:hypothetical protein NLI96_g4629 [Meripilus lineatus]|uniref:Uncharacterized protein n=1 Tax=Meripilus lineatus TaxID=2056292 RepID=A0AAD5YHU6_9APHY|nr:hypothetical protein NLI96_g4629 [Physisporinus lineatus]